MARNSWLSESQHATEGQRSVIIERSMLITSHALFGGSEALCMTVSAHEFQSTIALFAPYEWRSACYDI